MDDPAALLRYKIEHLFLPPRLPQKHTLSPPHEHSLALHIADSAHAFLEQLSALGHVDASVTRRWRCVGRLLCDHGKICLGADAPMDRQLLASIVNGMRTGHVLPLYIGAQNAGVILRKISEEELTFESFFASLPAGTVMQTAGKPVAQFPASPRLPFPANPDLIEVLCGYLAELHTLVIPDALPHTKKAGNTQAEYRESTNPWYITDFITTVIHSFSAERDNDTLPQTNYVVKRLGDQVLWKSAELPWRRSPALLVLKVALQTTLVDMPPQYGYKAFMAFMLSRLASEAADAGIIADDVLYVMKSKIAQRVYKLRSTASPESFPIDVVLRQNEATAQLLQEHWKEVQREEALPIDLSPPRPEEITEAKILSLGSSCAYLAEVITRDERLKQTSSTFDAVRFEAGLKKSSRRNGRSPPEVFSSGGDLRDVLEALRDVSEWLESDRPSAWMDTTGPDARLPIIRDIMECSLNVLGRFMESGDDSDPEHFSSALLNVLDLWVIMDKTVVEALPLLKDYSPELTVMPLSALLLRRKRSMERLSAIERYIASRSTHASHGSIFHLDPTSCASAFGARYDTADRELRALRLRIQRAGEKAKRAKQQEHQELERERQSLLSRAGKLSCEYYTGYNRWGQSYTAHSSSCTKCQLEKRANNMRITVFEEPLPGNTHLAAVFVFELRVPPLFSLWRSITLRVVKMFAGVLDRPRRDNNHVLNGYTSFQSSLFGDVAGQCDPHVTLASSNKSFLKSHYSSCHLPCSESDVTKNHGPQWFYYDQSGGYLPNSLPAIELRDHCTPPTLLGPYKDLHWSLPCTSHTPNEVIARQSECPASLSLHEWEAFGGLRSGQRLQWHNIATQLEIAVLKLGEPAVHVLIRQAALQVESPSSGGSYAREAHATLLDEAFAQELLYIVRRCRAACDGNWEDGWVASTLSLVGHRLAELSALSAPHICSQAVAFLHNELRPLCMRWMREIMAVMRKAGPDTATETLDDIRHRLIQVCLACRDTYRARDPSRGSVFHNTDALSDYLQCSLVLNQNLPSKLKRLPAPLRILVQQDMQLSVDLVEELIAALDNGNMGIDKAICKAWPGFVRSATMTWSRVLRTHWVACRTSSDGAQAKTVHFDILGGALYVDGASFQALPREILEHPLYLEVFPAQYQMQILPSTMPGMTYQCQYEIDGHQIHFRADGETLVIRSKDESGRVSEFVPRSKIAQDIPSSLLEECIARARHAQGSGVLDFIPRHRKLGWNPHAQPAWTLRGLLSSPELFSCLQDRQILCPHSDVVSRLGRVFSALETDALNMVVDIPTAKSASPTPVSAYLPRYTLEFFFDEHGLLASKEFPNHVVSSSRDIGTLYGVEKLVLRSHNGPALQRALVPAGPIVISPRARHPRISVCPPPEPARHLAVHILEVNTLIGQVRTDGGLESFLTLLYLHATSSSHQEDPLTGERGVDRALRMLESASSYAFTHLSPPDIQMLSSISSLTPVRRFYPEHLEVMETTFWNSSISPLSQSELFAPLVSQITGFAKHKSVFDPPTAQARVPLPEWEGAESLRLRAFNRNARLSPYTEEYWRVHGDTSVDVTFSWRVRDALEDSLSAVQSLALRVHRWDVGINTTTRLWEHFVSWNQFSSNVPTLAFLRPCLLSDWSQPQLWFALYQQCAIQSARTLKFSLIFTLAFVMYGDALDGDLIESILGIAVHGASKWNALVSADTHLLRGPFNLADGWELNQKERQTLESKIRQFLVSFSQSSEYHLPRRTGEDAWAYEGRCNRTYHEHADEQVERLVEHLRQQWPCARPSFPPYAQYSLLDMSRLEAAVHELYGSMEHNRKLRLHASRLQSFFDLIPRQHTVVLRPQPSAPAFGAPGLLHDIPCFLHVMGSRPTPVEREICVRVARSDPLPSRHPSLEPERSLVQRLIGRLPTDGGFAMQYKKDLGDCANAMGNQHRSSDQLSAVETVMVPALLPEDIRLSLRPESPFDRALQVGGIWPSSNVRNCLSYLSLHRRRRIPTSHWLDALNMLALSLVRLQRERRLDTLRGVDFGKELDTDVGQGYDAASHSDWLLVQLDSNVTIRPVQAAIAERMLSPHNRVMQLNMGEGKSSVIIPITSTTCADGLNLACVIVLKPLCSQMFQLLSQRISGLADRRLYYLPFSRDTTINSTTIRAISHLFKECASNGGVLLCQPEHLLSFQLMGSSMLCARGMTADTQSLLEVQDWVSKHSRYILDESDEILSHKYQLIYTIGSPGPLEGHPERWLILQQVLGLVNSNADTVLRAHPDGLELERGCNASQRFRRMRILTDAAYDHLSSLCCADIVHRNAIALLPLRSYPATKVAAVLQFISTVDTPFEVAKDLEDYSGDAYPHLLLLRGLFAHGILKLALKEKRWRVDYGLDLKRSRLAVPYRAKDSPALRAEFGHPDVILTLTSLSYYYGGLNDEELDTAFDHLLKTDNPALRYDDWTKGQDLPSNLQTLKGINLKDAEQRSKVVYPTLQRVKPVVDFYLAECVFPKEARQFEHKLTTNPWDIARTKGCPTTGFSGTNDNRYLLPTSIVQEDMPSQLHTNALVLDYVLRPENRTVVCKDCDAAGIIEEVVASEPHVSVVLDVGAQVLELENEEMARQWLERETRSKVEAAVYFGSDDELYVVTRDGRVEQLRRSFYRDQLGKTLVYLDEAHTRGTDLKLPEGTRALLTLGPKLPKDKVMQGCMRMRKLGRAGGHSILFLASSEIQSRIRDCIKDNNKQLDSSDVLVWTMHETIRQTTENGALWVNQGLNFDVRQAAWEAFDNRGRSGEDELTKVLLEREAHPLKDLYGLHDTAEDIDDEGGQTARQREIFQRCNKFGFAVSRSSRLLEEQERELAHEKETEREVQRAPPAEPTTHAVSPHLKALVKTGASTFEAFRSLHSCLARTSVQTQVSDVSSIFLQGQHILATNDFVRTIVVSPKLLHEKDGFIRPVQWIVSTKNSPDVLLLISPFEANDIIADIRRSPDARLHLYAPRVSRNTRAFDDLTFLITPSSAATSMLPPTNAIIHELNLFAGNLFLRNEAAYREVCQLLGLHLGEIPDALKGKVGVDGFVAQPADRAALGIVACVFEKSPSAVLRALLDLRRKGQGFLLTHIGQMLYGNEVGSDEF
ncbi:hypothetical protein EV122DRAFT_210576 [Schizophyllum commune]